MGISSGLVLTDYIESAMTNAEYDKLEDGTFTGKISECKGVISFAKTLTKCEKELRSVLEEWIILGLKMKHPLPIINNINLDKEFTLEPITTLQET